MDNRNQSDLTDVERRNGDRALIEALAGSALSFGSLWPIASKAMGFQAGQSPAYRFTDAWLQKMRRAGHVELDRQGRTTVWRLTDAGRSAHIPAHGGGVS
jgi:hypothetical protein